MSRDLERLSGLVLSVFCAVAPCADVEADEGFAVASTPLVRVDAANAATFTSGVWRAAAWRNERVHAPFVIRGKAGAAGFTASVEPDSERDAKVFSAASVQIRWVRETLASANYRYPWVWVDVPEHKVGDILDPSQPFALTDRAFRALWVTVKTPSDAEPGRYRASLAVRNAAGAEVRCRMEIEVLPVSLPARRKMYLDIWQTPWTIARYYGVKPFSPEHYARMEPIFRELAAAGQKAITATITDYPWNVRKNIDTARSMVRYVKRRDGSFVADFTTLDEYVDFAKRCGIGPQIHCYALVKFQKHRDYWYHDEATGEEAHMDCDPGTPEYEAYWGPLLRQLEAHAKEKGWTGDIYAALDELPPHETSLTAKLVKKYAPSLKFQMAGDVNPADFGDVRIDNYSQALRFDYISREFLAETARRKARGLITTYYICCVPERPNSFLTSPLAEQRWLGLFAAAKGFDGFLKSTSHRWMMDRDPLVDASCKPGWAPGECFLIYPGPLLSLRWEMMVDGFEEFDKVAILRESGRMTPRVRNALKWVDYQRLLEGKTSDLERIVENAVHEIETASRGDGIPHGEPVARWTYMPPRDVDPGVATLGAPIPRRWSGQKAALAFVRVVREPKRVTLSWADAASARNVPKLKGDPRSLWTGHSPDKPPVTEPRLYAMGKDGRLFRDDLPAAHELMPFVVAVDGNPEDGYGGCVLCAAGADGRWSFSSSNDTLTVAGEEPSVIQFDGTWLAGLQAAARAKPEFFRPPDGMSPDMWVTVVSEWVQDDGKWNCAADGWGDYLRRRLAARAKLLADPRLKETLAKGILFNTRRPPTWNHCVAQYFGWRQRPGGTLLVLEEPGRSLKTRDVIAGRMPNGSYLEPRLSYDASKALFAFVETDGALDPYSMSVNEKGKDDHYYHLWSVNLDGTGLKQLTRGVYEDFMPEFLPDGGIAFMSSRRRSQSRCFWFGYSNRWQAYTMFRMRPDGSDIRQLSWNDVAEWFPTMANNGELLFARWDYIDRDAVRHQNMWSMRPDGTNPKAVWGNETPKPHCTFQPRAIPGSRKIACIASAHHACTGGPLILIDPSVDENSEAAVTHVTPGHYPENDMARPAEDASPEAHNDWYNSPHPYGEDLFLVCWSRAPLQYEPSRPAPNDSLGLYVLAADGRREVLWRDGCLCACSPQPLVPRPVPPKLESQFDQRLAADGKGEVFLANVYRGLTNAVPGSLKEVRVVQIFPRTTPDQYRPNTGRGGHENARAVLGTVPLEADGSARFVVPAEKPILFQVLDKDGFAWRTMRSTTSLMPGERVSCVGCHESKREVSYGPISGAMKQPAHELTPTPESGRPWGFVENVQPIFDAKCVSCHGDEKPPKGIALTRTPDPRFGQKPTVVEVGPLQYSAPFTKSYATLCFTDEPTGRKPNSMSFEKPFQWWKVRMGKDRFGRPAPMVPCWVEYNLVQTTPEGPGVNALGSGLFGKLSRGRHAQLLTDAEKRVIATWLDLNATFYGCYEEPCLTRQLKGEPIPMPERQ